LLDPRRVFPFKSWQGNCVPPGAERSRTRFARDNAPTELHFYCEAGEPSLALLFLSGVAVDRRLGAGPRGGCSPWSEGGAGATWNTIEPLLVLRRCGGPALLSQKEKSVAANSHALKANDPGGYFSLSSSAIHALGPPGM
jgi:hypothetical protein